MNWKEKHLIKRPTLRFMPTLKPLRLKNPLKGPIPPPKMSKLGNVCNVPITKILNKIAN